MTARSAVFEAPVELVKIIFDEAARNEKVTAATLAQVCQAARQWAIPILYENVELDNPSAKRFDRMLDMSSPSSLAPTVKTLCGPCLPNLELLSKRCTDVEAMTLHNYDAYRLNTLVMPSLRHVTIAGSLRYVHFTPDMTGLASVSHLRFPNDVPRLPEGFAKCVPRLTHFSCCYQLKKKSRHDELERCLGTVLEGSAVQLVVVHIPTRDAKEAAAIADTTLMRVTDARIVFTFARDLPEETQNLTPKYDTVWVVGEKKLRGRRTVAANNCC